MSFTVYMGYDAREDLTYRVARYSLLRRSSIPVEVIPLNHMALRAAKLLTRPYSVGETGQMIDARDGKFFSTAFSFSRFLVPELARRTGKTDPVMFVDCDWLFLDDVAKLLRETDTSLPVSVVKHDFTPNYGTKMDGIAQTAYPRKLWSSLMLFNAAHPAHAFLTLDKVNEATGGWLHNFSWLQDEEIGSINEKWNWLPKHSPTTSGAIPGISAIHYTDGTPQYENYADVECGGVWLSELKDFARHVGENPGDLIR